MEMKNTNNNILITSAGRRVSLVRSFQIELKKRFPNASVYTSDSNPELSSACMYSSSWFKTPRLDELNYISELLNICINNKIAIIIPTIDTELELLSHNYELFLEHNISLIISSPDFIAKCRDKRIIHDFFESNNIEIAAEYNKSNLKFPLFIKPSDGSRSMDTFYIESEKDLTDYHFSNPKFMFLEYLDHKTHVEYTCDLYYGKDNNLKCVVPRKRIEVRNGEVTKGKTEKNNIVEYVKKNLSIIEGARGCLTLQFFRNIKTGRLIGIEINPRFGGGYPLSYFAGANFPSYIIDEYIENKEVEYFEDWEKDLLLLRYDDEVLVKDYEG